MLDWGKWGWREFGLRRVGTQINGEDCRGGCDWSIQDVIYTDHHLTSSTNSRTAFGLWPMRRAGYVLLAAVRLYWKSAVTVHALQFGFLNNHSINTSISSKCTSVMLGEYEWSSYLVTIMKIVEGMTR